MVAVDVDTLDVEVDAVDDDVDVVVRQSGCRGREAHERVVSGWAEQLTNWRPRWMPCIRKLALQTLGVASGPAKSFQLGASAIATGLQFAAQKARARLHQHRATLREDLVQPRTLRRETQMH